MMKSTNELRVTYSFNVGIMALFVIMSSPFFLLTNSSVLFITGLLIPFVCLFASFLGLFLALRSKIKGVRSRRIFFSFIINGAVLIFSIVACILIVWLFWSTSLVWSMDQGKFGDFIGN